MGAYLHNAISTSCFCCLASSSEVGPNQNSKNLTNRTKTGEKFFQILKNSKSAVLLGFFVSKSLLLKSFNAFM